MPILRARGEAEALCAQLNREGLVEACITADSDAFLFGAKCVIKHLNPKSKVNFFSLNLLPLCLPRISMIDQHQYIPFWSYMWFLNYSVFCLDEMIKKKRGV